LKEEEEQEDKGTDEAIFLVFTREGRHIKRLADELEKKIRTETDRYIA